MAITVKFYGVRGSIACPAPSHIAYGGNTSCILVDVDGYPIILDAGTGLRGVGQDFLRESVSGATLLLTHTHWDHITGFPFFAPAYRQGWDFRVMAGHLAHDGGIEQVLASQMAQPMFPIPLEAMRASIAFEDFEAGAVLTDIAPNTVVRTRKLNHPNGATGYRIEAGGVSLAYITDTEHRPGQPDRNVLALMEGADLAIYDASFTDQEFPAKVGWGHSTWQEGVRLADAAQVGTLVLFHHDPDHDDAVMTRIEAEARVARPGTIAARDNMTISLAR